MLLRVHSKSVAGFGAWLQLASRCVPERYGVDDDGDPDRPNFEKLQDPTVNYTYTAVSHQRIQQHCTL